MRQIESKMPGFPQMIMPHEIKSNDYTNSANTSYETICFLICNHLVLANMKVINPSIVTQINLG